MRYIDAEDLKNIIKANSWSNPVVPQVVCTIIDRSPTADVVPKSEVDALRKELARYIKRDILRRYSNDKIATAVVLQMSPESFLEKEADEIVADVERKTLEKMREA